MPGIHKNPTIAFRPSEWERALIDKRAALSGLYKKDFIAKSCIYSNIVVTGTEENIQRIIDEVEIMQCVMIDIAEHLANNESEEYNIPDDVEEVKRDMLSLAITVVDILDGASYLFGKEVPFKPDWKQLLKNGGT